MRRRKATDFDVMMFTGMGHLPPDRKETIKKALEAGTLEFEESDIKDDGEDYTALVVDGKRVVTWRGF